jgi:hypothetical protein
MPYKSICRKFRLGTGIIMSSYYRLIRKESIIILLLNRLIKIYLDEGIIKNTRNLKPQQKCLDLVVESNAGGSLATSRATHAGKVKE